MHQLPVVAIVGRPNVGKSTFFNRVIRKKLSITDNQPGVTRDRIYHDTYWNNKEFLLMDTGGLIEDSEDVMQSVIREQVHLGVEEADVIILMCDVTTGVTHADSDIANILHKKGKTVVAAVNKVDNQKREMQVSEFYSLGFENVIGVSGLNGRAIGDLLDEVVKLLPDKEESPEEEDIINIAVIGKPNVGKSSFVNALIGYEKVAVSDIAGTTRDATDTLIEFNEKKYNLIDTAGLRRKSQIKHNIEFYSTLRTDRSIHRADVVFLILDAQEKFTRQDIRIIELAFEKGKPVLLLLNKWDLIEEDQYKYYQEINELINDKIQEVRKIPIMSMSALTKKRITKTLAYADKLFHKASIRIQTSLFNKFIKTITDKFPPSSSSGKRCKIYYATQASTSPPLFVIFTNNPDLITESYRRYIRNNIYDNFDFDGIPVKISYRNREGD